jgi:hypothetical protein
MSSSKREKILRAGLILSCICLLGSVVLLTQPPAGPHSRTAMIGTAIVGLLTGLTFFLQLKQKKTVKRNFTNQNENKT